MYHLNNHYEILQTIADSSIKNIIIESQLDHNEADPNIPYMRWYHEDGNISVNGIFRNRDKSFVGVPNQKWFEEALVDLNFKIVYNEAFNFLKVGDRLSKRCTITATR